MISQYEICRLCSNAVQQEDVHVINDNVKEILQTLLIKVDLTISEHPVICSNCHKRAEENCQFKNKCIFTEKSITPFVTENVKINLLEIRNAIIKSDVEDDKNVCRLCLDFIDNEMTLSETEKGQFAKYFPEINLNLTHFTVLCSSCYDTLQTYFIFVSSCSELEEQLGSYSTDYNTEQINSIKLEFPEEFLMNLEDDKKLLLINEEVNIKCEGEQPTDDKYLFLNSLNWKSLNPVNSTSEEKNVQIKDKTISGSDWRNQQKTPTKVMHSCTKCDYKTKKRGDLNSHILYKHTDASKIKKYKCDKCDYESKFRKILKLHILRKHTDPSKTQMYKCYQCNYETKIKNDLKNHTRYKHTDSSKITMYKCETCDYESKFLESLKMHVLRKHTDLSEMQMFKCEFCSYESKIERNLKKHVLYNHTNTKIQMFKCKHCNYESKIKGDLKNHTLYKHTDPSQVTMYKCESCDYESKFRRNLKMHILRKHVDPSQLQMYKCKLCDYKCKIKVDLKQHTLYKHTDLSEIKMYKCEECSHESKVKIGLERHVLAMHTDPSKITMYKCETCGYESKFQSVLKRHIIQKHGENAST